MSLTAILRAPPLVAFLRAMGGSRAHAIVGREIVAAPSAAPIFVLCAARSGSTLLRLMLDAHPDIACPAETNLSAVFSAIVNTAQVALDEHGETSERAVALCRHVAESLIGGRAALAGKTTWADKSLTSIDHAELLLKVYPEARFICLYRQCVDSIASLHEMCAWGYSAFGVEPYVRIYPGNLPLALASYWADRVTTERAFEDAHPGSVLRMRYEDLVQQPDESLAHLFEFVGVSSSKAAIRKASGYAAVGAGAMPGDVKARFRKGVETSSVGRGWSVPTEMIPKEVQERINVLSSELGYPPLRNLIGPGAVDASPRRPETGDAASTASLAALLETRATARIKLPPHRRASTMKLVLTDTPDPWLIDFSNGSIARRDEPANWVAVTDSETLLSLASGTRNAGTALRDSTLRIANPAESNPGVFLEYVDALLELIRD